MTHLAAHRNGVLCLLAVVAVAGCATRINAGGPSAAAAIRSATTAAPSTAAVTAAPSTAPALGQAAVGQQVNGIDQQLGAIDGQLNAANAGMNTSEGDPAQ